MTSAELPFYLASPASSPCLPVELLTQIVEEVSGDRDKLDYTTLRHLCLTSKSILPFARQALYRDISITFRDADGAQYEDRAATENLTDFERLFISSDGDRLQERLREAPHLAALTTGISLHIASIKESVHFLTSNAIRNILATCPNITRFRTPGGSVLDDEAISLTEPFQQSAPRLAHLHIGLFSEIVDLLAQLPTLKHLHLDKIQNDYGDSTMPALRRSYPFTLISLRWDIENLGSLFSSLLQASSASLVRLRCFPTVASDLAPHLTAPSTLTHLELAANKPIFGDTCDSGILDALEASPHLRTLRLSGVSWPLALISRLPTNLRVIYCDGSQTDDEMLEWVLLEDPHVALRRVVMEEGGSIELEERGAEHG
ncbi:hypothetical protein BCR35DRAFT_352916 [Leucosporidium creatinivorum]|uniref:F-box domain-containing protein n=1 Tax=Leucosporidium creatinivorum TaxID=106004 RepID=A0A1Y2F648_9BASI|nr:hypothetical protein BCR35DRAFT_352916 [Leucosporidium creatinivorum]